MEDSEDRLAVAALKFQCQCKDSAQNVGALDWVDHMWQYGPERRIVDEGAAKDHGNFGILLHAVRTAGIDHVGIGSDWDGVAGPPNGLEDVSKMPNLIVVLLKRGYSEGDVKKILGENFLRVIREVTGN